MNKTMYILKGQECRFENLTCENIVVNGSLHVVGKLKTKIISGNGFVYASSITAKAITANTVDSDIIVTDSIAAAHINAYDIHAVQGITVSTLIRANYVKTGYITYADAEIWDMQTEKAVKLTPKRRGLLGTLFASFIRSKWAGLISGKQEKTATGNHNDAQGHTLQSQESTPPAVSAQREFDKALKEAEQLLNDPEFMRLRALYKVTKETGDIWQLVKKTEPTDRAVIAATAA